MANATNSTRYLSVASGHIDSLINYVLDVKPYHTKLSEIVEEFLFEDQLNVKISEDHEQLIILGPDYLNKSANSNLKVWDKIGASRPLETLSAQRTIISDGNRKVFPIPLSVIPKLSSHSGMEEFIVGHDDISTFPGILRGVYSATKFEGPGIPTVSKNGIAMTEGVDYHVSHGAFLFNTYPGSLWKDYTTVNLSAFAKNSGALAYDNVYEMFGTISNISSTRYEEYTLTWSASTNVLNVVGSTSGFLGTCAFGQTFTSAALTFSFGEAYGDASGVMPFIHDGDAFVLTPREKITVAPTAPAETWSIIKTNPQALAGAPSFTRTASIAPTSAPSIAIFTQSLEWTPQSDWTILFTSDNTYTINAVGVSGYPVTVDLVNGCSYKDENIHFTLTPPENGFRSGDKFTFTVLGKKPNYLVYGSFSGWQEPATIGEWYWNGKIGFKIPALDYFAVRHAATITVSSDASIWNPVVVNYQEMTNIAYVNNAFIASGARSLVAESDNGFDWASSLTNFVTVGKRLIVIGDNGLIAETEDGVKWGRINSRTPRHLRGIDVISTASADTAATPNLIVIVGDNGTILTSLNGVGWTRRESGTNYSLFSVSHSADWIVAVGDSGTILRSQDRVTWIACSSPTAERLNKVKYLNGAFFAVGENGIIITSADAITWTQLDSKTTSQLNDITYGLGMYVAVGRGAIACKSTDGVTWTTERSKPINAIEFGVEEQVFVAVEHKINEVANFFPLRKPHSVMSPSIYSLIFRQPVSGTEVVGGTVQHSTMGVRRGFKVNRDWSDEFVSFKVGPSDDIYRPGEQIDVYLVSKSTFVAHGSYDDMPYDTSAYDTTVGKIEYPLGLMQEYFPQHAGRGAVIFPSITTMEDGKKIVIDKAMSDSVDFRIGKGDIDEITPPPELASVDGWVPLEYRYFDRRINANSAAEFPDLATYIDAYLGTDPDVKVFTISQPRYKTTNRPASAVLTFDDTFFNTYLPQNTFFSLRFKQADLYGEEVAVKITENLRIYARASLEFDETLYVASQAPSSTDVTGTAIAEGLQILVRHTDMHVINISVNYDVKTAGAGVHIATMADQYTVTHNFAGNQKVTIKPDAGTAFTVTPTTVYTSTSSSKASFTFTVPNGTGPFLLTLS